MIDINYEIDRLVNFALNKGLIEEEDVIYTRNRILEVLALSDYKETSVKEEELESAEPILENILNWAHENGVLESNGSVYRDLFDTKIMASVMPRPSEVIRKFNKFWGEDSKKATDYFYSLSKNSNYIRVERVKKDLKWKTSTEYGDLDITINLSKPEKDPKAIAAAKNLPANSYPKCLLCKENEGYEGRLNHPARQNHRIIPLKLNEENWYFQYSPYVYYNEHCIVFKGSHDPMKISKDSFLRLLEFVEKFPHYFIGSNADLPIVGGSILSHDHFQGGNYEFPMAKAEVEQEFVIKGFEDVNMGIVKWPLSVIRIEGFHIDRIVEAAYYILEKWKNYSDETLDIISHSGETPHNTVTPIARMKNGKFQIDLVLRNNRTTERYPYGIFHPHEELHHIKKENIGLIEVMGLAVLPARLKDELNSLSYYLLNKDKLNEMEKNSELQKHKDWCLDILNKYSALNGNNVEDILRKEVGIKFLEVLKHCGVFKDNEAGREGFNRFIKSI